MRPLVICLVVALAACGDAAATSTTAAPLDPSTTAIDFDPADLVAYESPTYGFAIAYPSDWDVAEVTAENLIGFTSPVGTSNLTPNFNITVTEVSPDLPPVAYYQGEIERVTTSLENAEIIEVADVNVDGVVGRGLTLITHQSGVDIGISRIIVINSTRAYELSFFAEAAELQRLAPLVASIFQSLRFLD